MNNKKLLRNEITNLSMEELLNQLVQYKREYFNSRFQQSLGELSNTSVFMKVKKNIARIKTELKKRSNSGE